MSYMTQEDREIRAKKLHDAIRKGNEKDVVEILDSGRVGVNSSINYVTPLGVAVKHGRNNIAKLLIERGCNVDKPDRFLKSPLFKAIRTGNRELVDVLVTAGANLKHKLRSGFTPLHEAIACDSHQIVTALITAGADIHAANNAKETPLHLGCLLGSADIVQTLLANGADVNAPRGEKGNHPIHLAAFRGSPEVVQILLDAGADVDVISGTDKMAPIQVASMKNNLEALDVLLRHGCDIDARSLEYTEQRTALMEAVHCGHVRIISRLIEVGADVNVVDHRGIPLLVLAISKSSALIVSLLIQAGCDVNAHCRKKLTPFSEALTQAQHNIAKMLLLAGYVIIPDDLEQLQKLPVIQTMSSEDLDQLYFLINEVPSLKRLSRLSVRRHMLCKGPGLKCMRILSIPQSLCQYLEFPELEHLIPYSGSLCMDKVYSKGPF